MLFYFDLKEENKFYGLVRVVQNLSFQYRLSDPPPEKFFGLGPEILSDYTTAPTLADLKHHFKNLEADGRNNDGRRDEISWNQLGFYQKI